MANIRIQCQKKLSVNRWKGKPQILIIEKMVYNKKRAMESLLGVIVAGLDARRTQLLLSVNNNLSSILRFKIQRFKVEKSFI